MNEILVKMSNLDLNGRGVTGKVIKLDVFHALPKRTFFLPKIKQTGKHTRTQTHASTHAQTTEN